MPLLVTHAKAGGHPTSIADESKTCEAAKSSQCLWDWRQTPHCSWSRMYKAGPASWSDECCSGEWQCPASFAAEESICCRAGSTAQVGWSTGLDRLSADLRHLVICLAVVCNRSPSEEQDNDKIPALHPKNFLHLSSSLFLCFAARQSHVNSAPFLW